MSLSRGAQIPGGRLLWRQNFGTVWPNISGSSTVWNLIRVTPLAPIILRWLLYFWKNCGPLTVFSKWFLPLKFQLYDIHQSAFSNNVLVDYKSSDKSQHYSRLSQQIFFLYELLMKSKSQGEGWKYAQSGESMHIQTQSNHIVLG
jgi:hypothetical protein